MATAQQIADLKLEFQTGDTPRGEHFAQMIDLLHDDTSAIEAQTATLVSDLSSLTTTVAGKVDASYVNTAVNTAVSGKADTATVNAALAGKVDAAYVTSAIAGKANTSDVNTALSSKVDAAYVTSAIAGKVDSSYVDTRINQVVGAAPAALDTLQELGARLVTEEDAVAALTNTVSSKVDATYVTGAIANKVDAAYVTTAIAEKVDAAYVTGAIANKVDASYVTTAIANKVDAAYVTSAIAGKADKTPIVETKTAPVISSGTLTLDCSSGNVFAVNLNTNITAINFTNIPVAGNAYGCTVAFTADGTARTISPLALAPFKWAGGTVPVLTSTSGKVDIFVFLTWDGGTTWYSHIAGQNM